MKLAEFVSDTLCVIEPPLPTSSVPPLTAVPPA